MSNVQLPAKMVAQDLGAMLVGVDLYHDYLAGRTAVNKRGRAFGEVDGTVPSLNADDGEAIRRLAQIAWQVNEKTENIGARRLSTVLERLLEEVSFDAGRSGPGDVTIDAAYVDTRLKDLAGSEDLARYVL